MSFAVSIYMVHSVAKKSRRPHSRSPTPVTPHPNGSRSRSNRGDDRPRSAPRSAALSPITSVLRRNPVPFDLQPESFAVHRGSSVPIRARSRYRRRTRSLSSASLPPVTNMRTNRSRHYGQCPNSPLAPAVFRKPLRAPKLYFDSSRPTRQFLGTKRTRSAMKDDKETKEEEEEDENEGENDEKESSNTPNSSKDPKTSDK